MKKIVLGIVCLCCAASFAMALTIEEEVTPEFVRAHSKELAVKVERNKQGLLAFTVTLNLAESRYVLAQLTVKSDGKTLAETATPAFTKNKSNAFYFSVDPQYLAESEYSLSVSGFGSSNGEAVPVPGTKLYQIKPAKFVSAELLKKVGEK